MASPSRAKPHLPEQLELTDEDLARRAAWLDETMLSRGLQWRQIETLAGYWQACRATAGKTVLPEGWRPPFMGIIIVGKLRAEKLDSAGTPRPLAEFGPGKIFGEMSLVDGEPASAGVVALEQAVLLALTAERFECLRAEQPSIALSLLTTLARLLSQKLRATSGKLVDLL